MLNKRRWSERDLTFIVLVGEIIANALKNLSYKAGAAINSITTHYCKSKIKRAGKHRQLQFITANRRCFDLTLECEIKRCARSNQLLSLIICDIDFFKNYNDSYGHQQGDEA
ncbi:diguanylate cyclase domain-containing protein (plasmid) [Pseudoalteromonas espejiana]